MGGRTCGACTACCEGWVAANINGKKVTPGRPCEHCSTAGCKIYEQRPQDPCKSFKCGWLLGALPEEMRPDLSGVIVLIGRKYGGHEVIWAAPTGKEIPEESLELIKQLAQSQSLPLIYLVNYFNEDGTRSAYDRSIVAPRWYIEHIKERAITEADIFRL